MKGNRHKEKERDAASTNTNTQHAISMKTSQKEKIKLRKDVKSKFKGNCFNCGQTGHFANKSHKDKKQPQLLHARQAVRLRTCVVADICLQTS